MTNKITEHDVQGVFAQYYNKCFEKEDRNKFYKKLNRQDRATLEKVLECVAHQKSLATQPISEKQLNALKASIQTGQSANKTSFFHRILGVSSKELEAMHCLSRGFLNLTRSGNATNVELERSHLKDAIEAFNKSAKLGNKRAYFHAAITDEANRESLLEEGARKGDPCCQAQRGIDLLEDPSLTPKQQKKAEKLLLKAAAQKWPEDMIYNNLKGQLIKNLNDLALSGDGRNTMRSTRLQLAALRLKGKNVD